MTWIRDTIFFFGLIGLAMWTIILSHQTSIELSWLDEWPRNALLPLMQLGLILGAFRLGMYHALVVPLHRLAIGLGILGIAVAGLWYLQGPWVGASQALTLIAFAVAGDRFKESELREKADEEDSNGGWPP